MQLCSRKNGENFCAGRRELFLSQKNGKNSYLLSTLIPLLFLCSLISLLSLISILPCSQTYCHSRPSLFVFCRLHSEQLSNLLSSIPTQGCSTGQATDVISIPVQQGPWLQGTRIGTHFYHFVEANNFVSLAKKLRHQQFFFPKHQNDMVSFLIEPRHFEYFNTKIKPESKPGHSQD